jgi:hypothetical protein
VIREHSDADPASSPRLVRAANASAETKSGIDARFSINRRELTAADRMSELHLRLPFVAVELILE